MKRKVSQSEKGYIKCKDRIQYGWVCRLCFKQKECEEIEMKKNKNQFRYKTNHCTFYGPECKGCIKEKECEEREKKIWEDFKKTEDYKFELKHGKQFPEDFDI